MIPCFTVGATRGLSTTRRSPVRSPGAERDLLNILDTISKAGAAFKSLADAWADTTTPHGKLLITMLGGIAEFERSLILARTSDGRNRAKARGVRFGRPAVLDAHQRAEAIQRLAADPALRRRLGTHARRRVEADFSLEAKTTEFEHYLDRIVS